MDVRMPKFAFLKIERDFGSMNQVIDEDDSYWSFFNVFFGNHKYSFIFKDFDNKKFILLNSEELKIAFSAQLFTKKEKLKSYSLKRNHIIHKFLILKIYIRNFVLIWKKIIILLFLGKYGLRKPIGR